MRFKGLDLNLLVALDALLRHRSISRAADSLHLSQPAMSAALGRLRDYFDDPILAAHGKRMVPTAYALRLQPLLTEALSRVEGLVSASSAFDPATTPRRFRVGTSDYLAIVLFTKLMPAWERDAPRLGLEIITPFEGIGDLLDQGEIDLMMTPEDHIRPDHPAQLLFEERHVIAGWSGNPLLSSRISADAFFAAGHIAVEIGRHRRGSFAENHLKALGRERRIDIVVASFSMVPEMLVNSHRVAVMHERLARHYASRLPLAVAELPFEFPIMREMMQFHHAREGDPGLRWLMEQVRSAA